MKNVRSISIVCPNYNNGRYLEDFFTSILNSTVWPEELILIEDGSDDSSMSIIKEYAHLNFLKIIEHSRNMGLVASLNEGISLAKGKYILRLDSDDFITPDRMEAQYQFLENNSQFDVVGSNVFYYNESSARVVYESKLPEDTEEIYKEYISGHHGLVHASIMGRRSVLASYEFKTEAYPAEEYEFFSRMVQDGILMFNISKPLTYYRIHTMNVSRDKVKLSVLKTVAFRNSIFKVHTSQFEIWRRIRHWYYYRKSLKSNKTIFMYWYIFFSTIFYPSKIIKRIFQ